MTKITKGLKPPAFEILSDGYDPKTLVEGWAPWWKRVARWLKSMLW